MAEVSASEAKTHLSRLRERARQGGRIEELVEEARR
jgi:antitoxin (DNA-binding transcriptional repressor) of toxin-antitoxin stability system